MADVALVRGEVFALKVVSGAVPVTMLVLIPRCSKRGVVTGCGDLKQWG